MNATQQTSPARMADLSPCDIKVCVGTPTPSGLLRNAVCLESLKGEPESDAAYGCVDWYQYPGTRAEGAGGQL